MAGRKVKMRSMWRYHAPNPKNNKFKRMDFEEEIFFLRVSANEWLYCYLNACTCAKTSNSAATHAATL
jgi:hypothetical protein